MYCQPKLGSFDLNFCSDGSFKLFSFSRIFTEESYDSLKDGFQLLKWDHQTSHFYRQYSSKILPSLGNPFAGFFQAEFFHPFKSKLEHALQVPLRNACTIIAHKLVSSQEIGIHNDFCDPSLGYEQFRFIFQFADRDRKPSGGEITFLHSEEKSAVIRKYNYAENEGICFEISPKSFHFVAPIEEGERYTLVMYLWDARKQYDGSGIQIQ